MRLNVIRAGLGLLLALPLAQLLTACGDERPAFIKPPPLRTDAVADPVIPTGKVACPDNPEALCLTDEQSAGVTAGFARALDLANAKLLWLKDWFAHLP